MLDAKPKRSEDVVDKENPSRGHGMDREKKPEGRPVRFGSNFSEV